MILKLVPRNEERVEIHIDDVPLGIVHMEEFYVSNKYPETEKGKIYNKLRNSLAVTFKLVEVE